MMEDNDLWNSDFYLKDTELAKRYDIARQSVWRWVQTIDFPAPVKLSPGCSRWRLADVEAWESEKASAA